MSTNKCQPCERQEKHEIASHWCVECQEILCTACSNYHKVLKVTKEHRLITFSEYASASEILTLLNFTCENHAGKSIEYYCREHEISCCILCKQKEHSVCCDFHKIEELVSDVDFEKRAKSLLFPIDKAIRMLDTICENRSQNIKLFDHQRGEFLAIIGQKKEQLQNLISDLDIKLGLFDKTHRAERKKIRNQIEEFTRKREDLKKRRDNVQSLMHLKPVSDVYLFLAEGQIRQQIENENLEVRKSIEKLSDMYCECSISFKTNDQNETIEIVDNISFKSVPSNIQDEEKDSSTVDADDELNISTKLSTNIQNNPAECLPSRSKVNFPLYRAKSEACIPKPADDQNETIRHPRSDKGPTETPARFKFEYKFSFRVEKKKANIAIRCARVLPSGDIIIGESSEPRLLIYAKLGFRHGEMKLNDSPESIAIIDDGKIAVTLQQSVLLVNVSLNDLRVIREIEMHDNCYGIAHLDDMLVVNCENDGLKVMTLEGNVKKTLSFVKGILNLCAGFGKTVLYLKRDSETVHFLNLNTANIRYQHCQNLLGTNGITRDREGSVFVSCNQSNMIYMLQRKNNKWVCVLNNKNNIDSPWNTDYDRKSDEIIVINNSGKSIYVYQKQIL